MLSNACATFAARINRRVISHSPVSNRRDKLSPVEPHIKRSLKASIRDGAANAAMVGFGESYLGAFAVFLKSTPLQVGVLAAVPPLIGALCQSVGVQLMELAKRRRMLLVIAASAQALVWVPLALLALFAEHHPLVYLLTLGLVCLYFALGGTIAPIWNSLIGDIVPPSLRGRFFARRTRLMGPATFLALLSAGWALNFFHAQSELRFGFFCIFLMAGAMRLLSVVSLTQHVELPFHLPHEDKFSFWQFIERAPHSNFVKFVLFVASTNAAANFASPYFAVYMLQDLKIPFITYSLISAATVVAQFATLEHWGQLSDRFGNKKILNVTAVGVAIVPFFWLFSSVYWYLILVQLLAGSLWAGFNLAAGNFLFDAVSASKRGRCVAYQSIINGVGVCAGSFSGAYFISHTVTLGGVFSSTFLALFFLSGILRMIAVALFLSRFREVREVTPIRHHKLIFEIVGINSFASASFQPEAQESKRSKLEAPLKKRGERIRTNL